MNKSGNARTSVSKERIGIAMSGGVDSTATALILRENTEVEGFFMRLAQPNFDQQLARVEKLAEQLGITLHVIDLRQEFNDKVLEYFANAYFRGTTPNPCMVCNREVKFGLFQKAILHYGMNRMATGHYARVTYDKSCYHLHDGLDLGKNQSYFLARLTQQQLANVIFPLGEKQKEEVYTFVEKHGFNDFGGLESQDVCFLADESVGDYLEERYPQAIRSGPVMSTEGVQVGKHTGLFRYTIGQRRGLGIPDSSPWYVTGIDAVKNTLIVGKSEELFKTTIRLQDIHWLSGVQPDMDATYSVRIRYSHRGAKAKLQPADQSTLHILFAEPQRAITPGQFAVIYSHDEVIGSGVILD